jgi:hypothetical protein
MLNPEHPGLNVDVSQVKNCHKNLKKDGKGGARQIQKVGIDLLD